MSAKIKSSVVIAKPAEEVFPFVLHMDKNAPKMDPDLEYFEKTSEGPPRPGTTFKARGRAFGRHRDFTVQLTYIEPNQRIDFESRVGPIAPRMSWAFQETNGGTKVTLSGDANPIGAAKLLSPLIRRVGQRVWDQRLARMKLVLEG